MNKKKINILLLCIVVGVWGILGYKFFSNTLPKTENDLAIFLPETEAISSSLQKKVFNLKSYDRDPFLGRISHKKTTIISKNQNRIRKIKPAPKSKTNTPWPKVHYIGYVNEQASIKPLVLLKINNKLYRKRTSFKFPEGIIIKKFYTDSLLVSFNKEEKIVKK